MRLSIRSLVGEIYVLIVVLHQSNEGVCILVVQVDYSASKLTKKRLTVTALPIGELPTEPLIKTEQIDYE